MRKNALRKSINIFIILLIASIFFYAFGYYQLKLQSTKRINSALTTSSLQNIMQFEAKSVNLLDSFAKSADIGDLATGENLASSLSLIKTLGEMKSVAYVNSKGELTSSEGDSALVQDSEYFKAAMSGQRFVGKITSGTLYLDKIAITSPIKAKDGTVDFIMGVYDPSQLADALLSGVYRDELSILINSQDGELLTAFSSKASGEIEYRAVDEFWGSLSVDGSYQTTLPNSDKKTVLNTATTLSQDGVSSIIYVPTQIGDVIFAADLSVVKTDIAGAAFILFMIITILTLFSFVVILAAVSNSCSRLVKLEDSNEQLKTLEKEYKVAADHKNQMMFRFYPESGSVQLSEELSAIQGLPRIIKNSPETSIESGLIDGDSAQAYLQFFKSIHDRAPSSKCMIKCNFSTGTAWYDMDYTMLKSTSGESYAVISAADVTERKNQELEILKHSMEDSLTGALNRKAFEQKAVELINKYNGQNHGVIMLDIDNFKNINDSFGHIMGDHVLYDTCDRLRGVLKSDDLLGRLGGDEFMMILRDIPCDDAAINANLQAMVDAVRAEFKAGNFVSASLGMSIYPRDGKNFDELYRTSDLAAYHAKQTGRGKFVVYSKELENNKALK